ncbi:granzyme G-like [Paramisgurnus dabryanus]|uniref:granzyme G-like n=1 Tax=Paramisgurnus dabryanus TaxID=90735 RepID=UPI0031F42C24
MSIFWFITTLLLLHFCTPGVGVVHSIVNGKVSIPHSHPYMVYIRDTQTHSACGGFLVREDFVMTAAHCKKDNLRVYLGVDDTNRLPEGIEAVAIPHPDFANKQGHDDIMLLKLKTIATLNKNVKTIGLPKTKGEAIPSNCMAMGWGWKEYTHTSPSNVLREVNLTLIQNCDTSDLICTEGESGPSQGDFGGPLICGNVPHGIGSYYINKGATGIMMYSKISHYLPWIHEIMNVHELWKSKLDAFNISDIRVCMIVKMSTP